TRDAANALAATNRIVIDEVMYHPAPNEINAADNDEDEYIVLYNPNPFDITLMTEAGPWRIDGTVDYVFPSNTVFPAMSSIVLVEFDPADTARLDDFQFIYDLTNGQVTIMGPFLGNLDNRGGRVALERPQAPDLIGESISWVIVDEMIYFDRAPWPTEADGFCGALHRVDRNIAGTDPSNWAAGSATPDQYFIGFAPKAINTAVSSIGQFGATLGGELLTNGTAATTVFLYWGSTDARQTNSAWEFSANLGALPEGPIDTPVTGLSENTIYFYRYYVTNAVGGHWAFPTVSFKTAGPPEVDNNGPNLDIGKATLNAVLNNGTSADVTIFWGASDGGTNFAAWDNATNFGVITEGPFSTVVTGLYYGVEYFYRAYASNAVDAVWAGATTNFKTRRPLGFGRGDGLNVRVYDSTQGDGFIAPVTNLFLVAEDAIVVWTNDYTFINATDFTAAFGPALTGTETFSIMAEGVITIDSAGDYSFGTKSDDGSMVYIDLNQDNDFEDAGELVVDNRGLHGDRDIVGSVNLQPGCYRIAIPMYENGGGETMEARFAPGVFSSAQYNSMPILNPSDLNFGLGCPE
ncbi:MAG: hypothetical protein AAF492_17070, partial [Verrucomicrobiota bacterium]